MRSLFFHHQGQKAVACALSLRATPVQTATFLIYCMYIQASRSVTAPGSVYDLRLASLGRIDISCVRSCICYMSSKACNMHNIQSRFRCRHHVSVRRQTSATAPGACLREYTAALAAAACAVLLQVPPASADEITYRYKASSDPLVRQAQEELVQTYAFVSYYYLDGSFNGVPWEASFQKALQQSAAAASVAEVRKSTDDLLSLLGDPYTRLLTGPAAAISDAEQNGQVFSYGLAVNCATDSATAAGRGDAASLNTSESSANDPITTPARGAVGSGGAALAAGTGSGSGSAQCHVAYVAPGSAAARADVAVGDSVTAVGGRSMDAAVAADLKRTLAARDVAALSLRLAHPTNYATIAPEPPDAAAAAANGMARSTAQRATQPLDEYSVELSPAAVEINPVQFSTVSSPSAEGREYGYIRIGVFANGATERVADALAALPRLTAACPAADADARESTPAVCGRDSTGVAGLILDVRDNPGGSLAEGVAVAALFEPPDAVFMYAAGRDSALQTVRVEDVLGDAELSFGSGSPVPLWAKPSSPPIAILVNRNTASSSELLAAALRAGRGAHLVGETTVGKGRTQREVDIGAAAGGGSGGGGGRVSKLMVSVGRFEGAGGERLEEGGLKVDMACAVEATGEVLYEGGEAEELGLEADECVRLAMQWLDGGR
eukprot:jgi/Ulvmu1/10783/UM069_0017.1